MIVWLKEGESESGALSPEVTGPVAEIVEDVRVRGMAAVRDCARRFDRWEGPLRVKPETARLAADAMAPGLREAVEEAIKNVRRFAELQRNALVEGEWEISSGCRAGFRYVPMDSVGVYIPGGRYPLISSAIMSVVPAQVAGVGRIAACSPPGSNGVESAVLGALSILGVEEIWAIGGAQAIAALALGARDEREEIAGVSFIAGPGNAYVAEAKRLLFGTVGIDGLAGPSEVLIIADSGADVSFAARDLLAQSEHDPMARAVLVATDRDFARAVHAELDSLLPKLSTRDVAGTSWRRNGAIGVADSLDSAIAYANRRAPEHLQLAVADPRAALAKCTAYGAAFLGYNSCEVFGDYIAGTNHILPTDGRARHSCGLWVGSLLRALAHLDLTAEGASVLSAPGSVLARAEGLEAHAGSLLRRRERFSAPDERV